jgi:hypothetical protein
MKRFYLVQIIKLVYDLLKLREGNRKYQHCLPELPLLHLGKSKINNRMNLLKSVSHLDPRTVLPIMHSCISSASSNDNVCINVHINAKWRDNDRRLMYLVALSISSGLINFFHSLTSSPLLDVRSFL